MAKNTFIGIDVGGTKIAGGVVSQNGRVLSREKVKTPKNAASREIVQTMQSLILDLLKSADLSNDDIQGLGIAIPGIVDEIKGKIIVTPNLNLSNFEIGPVFEKKLKFPVAVGNDVNLGTLGEFWLGAGKGRKNGVSLFWGTGIGGGIVIDGKIYSGSNGAAAEMGHMIVDPTGPKCTCGNQGCLEAFAGRWAIERDIRKEIEKGKKSIVKDYSDSDLSRIKSKALKKSLEKGDPLVTSVLTFAADIVGEACISLRHIFDPDLFILGGGVIEACGSFLIPLLNNLIEKDPFFGSLPKCKVVPSELGDDAVFLGAAALILQKNGRVLSR